MTSQSELSDANHYRPKHNSDFVLRVQRKRKKEAVAALAAEKKAASMEQHELLREMRRKMACQMEALAIERGQWEIDRANWRQEREEIEAQRKELTVRLVAAQALSPMIATKMETIIRRACCVFDVRPNELKSSRRSRHVVFARHFVMYWTCRLTSLSTPIIGKKLGGLDHTTVLHGRDAYPIRRAKMGRNVRKLKLR